MVQMETFRDEEQIPKDGPLSGLNEGDATGVTQFLVYKNARHLRTAYRIPTSWLHFNIENGRHATLWQLLKDNNPGVVMKQEDPVWQDEIFTLLDGTWVDPAGTGVGTDDQRAAFVTLRDNLEFIPQTDPGLVTSMGAVMGGNRRLAALKTLAKDHPGTDRFQYFDAYIVPGGADGISVLDLWRLEIKHQTGTEAYKEDYSPENLLVKIRQGVNAFMGEGRTESQAITAVAEEFGRKPSVVKADLESLIRIDDYLVKIGRPGQYWAVKGETEVFTEVTKIERKIERSNLSRADKGHLRTSMHNIIKNGEATHFNFRAINRAMGPDNPTPKSPQPNPEAIQSLIDVAPEASDLELEPTSATKSSAKEAVQKFENSMQVKDASQTPFTNAERARETLKTIAQSVLDDQVSPDRFDDLEAALDLSKIALTACYDHLNGKRANLP